MSPDAPPPGPAAAARGTVVSAAAFALVAVVLFLPAAFRADEAVRRATLAVVVGLSLLACAGVARARPPASAWGLAGAALLLGLGAAWRPDRLGAALPTYALFALLGGGILAASAAVCDPRRADAATVGIAFAGAVAGAWCLASYVAGREGVGPFGRPGVAGPALSALLPFALAVRGGGVARAVLPALLALPLVAGVVTTGSRTGLVASVAAAVAFALVARLRARTAGLVLAVAAGAGVALLALRPGALSSETVRVRLGLARASAHLVAERPLAGHGPGSFASEVLRVRDPDEALLSAGRRPLAAHDDALHLAVEGGVPAALALAALLATGFVLAVRARRPALAASVAAIAVASVAEDPLLEAPTVALLALAAGAAAALGSRTAPARAGAVARGALAAAGLLCLALAVPLVAHARAETAVLSYLSDARGEQTLERETALAKERLRPFAGADRCPPHALATYRWAVHLARAGLPSEALRAFEDALAVDPGMTEARLDVAEVHRLAGRSGLAREALEEARRLDPTRFDVPLRLGHLALGPEPAPGARADPGAAVSALRLYGEAEALAPGRFETRVSLARLYRRTGDLAQAARELRAARDGGGEAPEVLLEGFRLAEAEGAPREALRGILVERVLLGTRRAPTAHAVRADAKALLDHGDRLEAEGLARAAGEGRLPTAADLAPARAAFDAATLRYEALLLAGVDDPAVVRSGAAVDAEAGRHRRALARWRAVLATPAGARDADLALEAARSARRVDPAEWRALSAWAHELLGDEMLAKGDLEAALREYGAAVDRMPDRAAAHVGLARAHARSGATDDARAALRRAVSLDPRVASEARADPGLSPLLE